MDSTPLQEFWGYTRPAALRGVELLDAHHCAQEVKIFNVVYSIAVMHTWKGQLLYKGQCCEAAPGDASCFEPGEVHVATPHDMRPGSFDVFIIEAEVLREHVAEHGILGNPVWRSIVHAASGRLRQKLHELFGVAHRHATAMELQCSFTELMEALVGELLEQRRAGCTHLAPAPDAAKKIRDCIHDDEPGLDLEMLARVTGLSRFQVIRSFKRRYGLPPQTFQLHLKIARAQRMLRRGYSPADVAAACGFVDQSHLGRHFKRLVSMTPGQYIRTTSAPTVQIRWQQRFSKSVPPYMGSRVPLFALNLAGSVY